MYSYNVWVRSQDYHGKTPLTYSSRAKLPIGTIVEVELRKKHVLAVIASHTKPPAGIKIKPITVIHENLVLPETSLMLLTWLLSYYPAASGITMQLFLPDSLPKKTLSVPATNNTGNQSSALPSLTSEQSAAIKSINQSPSGTFLIHGNTGTGKTRIYIELIKDSLRSGRSAIMLVPEIGLAPHIFTQFQDVFPSNPIYVMHSGLSPAERRNNWQTILNASEPIIVIGPRSALFAPIQNVGVIIADESHDDSYKQNNSPFYHGIKVAAHLARIHNAKFIMGSATPNISDLYALNKRQLPVLRLTKLAKSSRHASPEITIVNRLNKANFTTSRNLSVQLIDAIKHQLETKQQSLLFLNRRGSARITVCLECGWRALCPVCELPLTFHEDSFSLRCHTCGHNQKVPTSCPECNNTEIIFLGPGTKALETELKSIFPNATIARFDGDNLARDRLDKHLPAIQKGKIDIIIGTQILVKGFDIPRLGLVGIVDADASLSFPDFSTDERTFQLISQAIGRIGRGHVAGKVILQTSTPNSPLLHQAINKDWSTFYTSQLVSRRTHGFPPFTFLLQLECTRKRQASAITACTKLKEVLEQSSLPIDILGPVPAFHEKHNGEYTWQLVVRSPHRSALLKVISLLPSGWRYNIDPTHLL